MYVYTFIIDCGHYLWHYYTKWTDNNKNDNLINPNKHLMLCI